jgi:TRAP-type mannitol/chloroaromatic compound transport system permease small subunit
VKTIVHYIDRLNAVLGTFASWSTLLLVLLVCLDVLLRYFFQWSRVWMMELEIYVFAIIFLLGSAYAFQKDRHVRVDVFYSNMSIKKQAFVNIVGGLIFLLPWTLVMIYI